MSSIFKLELHDFWETGIEMEARFAAIPPVERTWYQHSYLWYRRHFWYILALGGTILLALIIWDMVCSDIVGSGCSNSKNKKGKQHGGKNALAAYGATRASQFKAGVASAPGAALKGIKSAPGAAFKGAKTGAVAAAQGFKNASGLIYKWLFTIFIFFAIGVFIMPTVAMIILGMLTFFIARGSIQRTVAM